MKFTKKCDSTQHKISISNRRRSSAGMFYTSSAGAVTSLILMLALPFIFGLTGATNLLGLGGSAHATTSTLTISVTDSVSLDMASSINTGNFAHSDTSTNNVSIITNNGTGYILGIKAKTNNSNALINSDDTSKTIPSITTSISEATYASSSSYNNTWGFRPSKLNSAANENYIQAPTSSSTLTTLDQTSSANPSTANNYNLSIGSRINSSTTPGSYSNVFVITVTANPIPYTITYNKNTTDTVTNMPANTSSQTYDETVNISNQVPARDGFNFKGWCTVQVADGGTCSGTTYNPDGGGTNLTWALDQTVSSNSLNLYAMWEQAGPKILYDEVAKQSKGTQTVADLRAEITTENSGVYEYNTSVFGTASDAASTSKIYYYRGILDNTVGSYGSDGDNAKYPNTVVLSSASDKSGLGTSDTCWRIVRTTGSGGVKMIYQGKWTGSTCANTKTDANAVSSVYFNQRSTSSTNNYDTKGRIIYVGYNFSSNSSHQTDTSSVSNSTLFVNGTQSNLRTQLESWYNSNMTAWTSKLETSAGWCNDRTTYSSKKTSSKTTSNIPYKTSSATAYFGAYIRTATTNSQPTLGCPNDTGYDLLTTSNGYIGVPSAPLTADEVAFAGSGSSESTTPYHANSYLRSGDFFWLLSPYYRYSNGTVYGSFLYSSGYLSNYTVSWPYGLRPSISLTSGTTAVSGTGTAADPWIVNPSSPTLYDTIASAWEAEGSRVMTNDTNANTGIQAAISTSNSGVFKYNPTTFGTASDAANTHDIYFYRGILDNTIGGYGSTGDNAKYPNTVVLSSASDKSGLGTSDTCWRIVRTTGSGGVKMIYQGKWTSSTCANAQTNAQVTTLAFGLRGNSSQSSYWYRNINRVGYTFNNDSSIQDSTTAISVDTVFGSDSSPSTNNERSNIKEYIEDLWYVSNMTSYTSKLEASAGYCNDRTAYSNDTTSTSLSTIPPYATSSASMNFGAYGRNVNATNAGKKPSLTCPRSTVDLYRYVSGSTGVSNQLKYPAALLTADEASFAGSGRSTASQGSAYHANSYLRSGSAFWLLSPYGRTSTGNARGFALNSDGSLNTSYVNGVFGVRPSISLTSGTTAVSGTGTATDPWIVNP